MTRGRTAALPTPGYQRAPVSDGLVVTHVNEKGDAQARYDFTTLPVPEALQEQLASVFADRVKPTGLWRNLPSSSQGWTMLGTFSRWLAEQDPMPGQIADLDAALWKRWRLSRPPSTGGRRAVSVVARLLRDHPELPAATAKELRKREHRDAAVEASYSDEELRERVIAAKALFRTAETRIRRNIDHLTRYRDGKFAEGTDDHALGELLEHLAAHADVPEQRTKAGTRFLLKRHAEILGGASREHTWKRLFLNDAEVSAVVVLLATREGWNLTSILEMPCPTEVNGIPDQPVYRVELEKRRRRPPHRYETRNLTDLGPDSTGRLLTRVLAVTAPARDFRAAQDQPVTRLLAFHLAGKLQVANPADLISEHVTENTLRAFKRETGLSVQFRRVRKAVNVRHRREPNQNSRDTHDSVYVMSDPHSHSDNEELIARGLERALTHAHAVAATVSPADANGGADTATAACTDDLHSPFSPWGVPCAASFLLCLACTNAVVMPRHQPRLAYLHKCLEDLRGSLPPERWDAVWADHFDRLTSLRTDHYTTAQWAQALEAATDVDRDMVDHLLSGDLDA